MMTWSQLSNSEIIARFKGMYFLSYYHHQILVDILQGYKIYKLTQHTHTQLVKSHILWNNW